MTKSADEAKFITGQSYIIDGGLLNVVAVEKIQVVGNDSDKVQKLEAQSSDGFVNGSHV